MELSICASGSLPALQVVFMGREAEGEIEMSNERVEGHFLASGKGEGSETGPADRIQPSLPPALEAELVKMRQNPANFTITERVKCKFCTEKKSAYHLINAKSGDRVVGSWCAVHGWLFFDSVGIPPTERLTAFEIEDNRLAEQRRRQVAARKRLN